MQQRFYGNAQALDPKILDENCFSSTPIGVTVSDWGNIEFSKREHRIYRQNAKLSMSLSWKSYVSTMAGSGAVLIPQMNCEEGSVWALCIITNRSSAASLVYPCFCFPFVLYS